jgi:hypothetical protein
MHTGPISPDEAAKRQPSLIPPEVYMVVNRFLSERFSASRLIIYQDDVLEAVIILMHQRGMDCDSTKIFANHWLDFEEAYRGQGWKVTYDKPGYCESYRAHWYFERAA